MEAENRKRTVKARTEGKCSRKASYEGAASKRKGEKSAASHPVQRSGSKIIGENEKAPAGNWPELICHHGFLVCHSEYN